MNKQIVTTAVIALIVGGGVGYFAHPASATQNGQSAFAGARGANFTGGMMRGGAGGGVLSGTVAKQDSGSITINTRDGSSHIVLISPATSVDKSVKGVLSDITAGANITVSGTTNSDGSVSATIIQIRPVAPAPAQ